MSTSFEDLVVWQRACTLVARLHQLLRNTREYALRDQMLRAAISVPSNIAEGRERNSPAEFKRFLAIARGSAAELRTQVYISKKIGIFNIEESTDLIAELKQITCMLQGLSDSIKS